MYVFFDVMLIYKYMVSFNMWVSYIYLVFCIYVVYILKEDVVCKSKNGESFDNKVK